MNNFPKFDENYKIATNPSISMKPKQDKNKKNK